jgi:hypothetical protein
MCVLLAAMYFNFQWLCFAAELHGLEDGSVEATFEVTAVLLRGMEMS